MTLRFGVINDTPILRMELPNLAHVAMVLKTLLTLYDLQFCVDRVVSALSAATEEIDAKSTAHTSNKCTSGGCKTCTRKHNTLLHLQTTVSEQAESSGNKKTDKGPSGPTVPDATRFGWILGGRTGTRVAQHQRVVVLHATISNAELHNQLQRFWHMEDIPNNSNNYTVEEQACERHFLETVSRDPQGRYVVKLPLKEGWADKLGYSREIALNRFRALEKRFDRDPALKGLYSEFMEEYIALGHMELISEQSSNEQGVYYIPHHCVFKETAEGPKIRVVFNASCKTDTGFSLNDLMLVGPVVQQDLASILLRFRIHKFVLVVDITKIIFWRKDNSKIEVYESVVVTYGTAAAAFVATNTIKHHAKQRAREYPLGSLCVKRNFYVDDMLTGADSIKDALAIRDQTIQLLKEASFELSKWGSNCPELLTGVSCLGERVVSLDKENDVRILGILWDQDGDFFRFSYERSLVSGPVTKRSILSDVSRLFNPLGLLGPTIVVAKLALQDFWQSGLDWDESVPQDTHNGCSLNYSCPISSSYGFLAASGVVPTVRTSSYTAFATLASALTVHVYTFAPK
ncbi:uncharacterized protein LOC112468803 [Temnothorax curvispinosus]|uniref:Uncharacterized protein LOC112468803 n=1 Tax=Temnothorax curvispinosus TaxID=300111 RepID=A0A6J1RMK9_9HYME|nr:uncharacterized protein LOC112468803 [Temnothorax curvispinosus]